jgi:hypothetical protein
LETQGHTLIRVVRTASLVLFAIAAVRSSSAVQNSSRPDAIPAQRIDPGLTFTMQRGSDTRVSLPRLTRFPDNEVMARVNADLAAESNRLDNEAKRCDADGKDKSSWEQTARVDLLTRDVLSIDVTVSYYCGGPHPDEEYRPLTYNLRNGTRFDFRGNADQLFLGDAIPSGELAELYRKHLGDPEGGCDSSFIDAQSEFFLHFAADGLVVNPEVPHFAVACGPEIVIPWREIKPLVKTKNPFATLFTVKPRR